MLVFGDSFASGYGLAPQDGFCPQLERELRELGEDIRVINAGIAGDTTLGALARAKPTYAVEHDFVLLEIGANDMLRGMPTQTTKGNIKALIEASEKPVYLVGIRAFPNYGLRYANAFDAIYPELSEEYQTGYYPFLFEAIFEKGTKESWRYFQRDRLHPNALGVNLVIKDLAPKLSAWIQESGAAETASLERQTLLHQ